MRIAAVGVGLVVAMLSARAQEPAPNLIETNKNLVRRAFQAFNQGDLKTLNEVFDPKAVLHSTQGKDRLRSGPFTELMDACPMCAALSDRKIRIDLIVAESNLVAVRSTWSGRYSGTLRGMPVAAKDVSVVYTNIYRVADGRIIENWAQVDGLSLAEQLGMKLTPAN